MLSFSSLFICPVIRQGVEKVTELCLEKEDSCMELSYAASIVSDAMRDDFHGWYPQVSFDANENNDH